MENANPTITRIGCDFTGNGRMCQTLDEAGVPTDSKWRSLILFMRDLKNHDYLTVEQKSEIQTLVVNLIQERNYTDQTFQILVRRVERIYCEPYLRKLQGTIQESEKLIQDFQELLSKRSGDIRNLEGDAVSGIESGREPQEIIRNLRETFRDVVTVMEEDASKLSQLSRMDGLTGLHNRRALDEYLQETVEAAIGEGRTFSLIMMDIDYFKTLNDSFGHRIGDQAIIVITKLMRETLEAFQSEEHIDFFAARYGGDEFTVVLPDMDYQDAATKAAAIRENISTYNFIVRDSLGRVTHKDVRIAVSAGVAASTTDCTGLKIEHLIEKADKALYAAKAARKGPADPHCTPAV